MGASEKFCLRWNDFERNISGAFQELRENKDFFDVTLACDDDQMQAHKVILSACSPFFKTMLRRNKHEHPLLYLRGIKYTDLVSVLNFMYHGEVSVAQEDLNSFLSVAEDLKVKGLTQNGSPTSTTHEQQPQQKKTHRQEIQREVQPQFVPNSSHSAKYSRSLPQLPRIPPQNPYSPVENDDINEIVPVKSEPLPSGPEQAYPVEMVGAPDEYPVEYSEYQEDAPGETGFTEYTEQAGASAIEAIVLDSMCSVPSERGMVWQCNQCGKEDKDKSMMKRHVESHFSFKQTCPYCHKLYKSRPSLQAHISQKHKS